MYRNGGNQYNPGYRDFQQRYQSPAATNYGNNNRAGPTFRPPQQQQPPPQQTNYYDPGGPTRRQQMTRPQQQPPPQQVRNPAPAPSPVRRINNNTAAAYVQRNNWPAAEVVIDDDEEYEEFRGSAIRQAQPQQQQRPVAAFKTAEASLCLVPQSPSVMEISRLLKGEKGDQGKPGDSFFEPLPEDNATLKLRQGEHLRIPGKLSVDQLEIRNPRSPQLLAAGEGLTSEEGHVTIQLSRELKGSWNASNAKVLLTPRQAGGQLFVPQNSFDPESNQFSIQCSERQRMSFDWFFYRI